MDKFQMAAFVLWMRRMALATGTAAVQAMGRLIDSHDVDRTVNAFVDVRQQGTELTRVERDKMRLRNFARDHTVLSVQWRSDPDKKELGDDISRRIQARAEVSHLLGGVSASVETSESRHAMERRLLESEAWKPIDVKHFWLPIDGQGGPPSPERSHSETEDDDDDSASSDDDDSNNAYVPPEIDQDPARRGDTGASTADSRRFFGPPEGGEFLRQDELAGMELTIGLANHRNDELFPMVLIRRAAGTKRPAAQLSLRTIGVIDA